jgi:hypothetical protein
MNKIIKLTLIFLTILISNCASDSNGILELTKPKMEFYNQFDFEPSGIVTYQFYHEYGFTDKFWHLITIAKPEFPPNHKYSLPLDKNILKKLKKIDLQKFIENKPILFNGDYKTNSDISLTAEQFHFKESDLNIGHQNGTYSVEINGDVELIRIYDADKGIEYIELKK